MPGFAGQALRQAGGRPHRRAVQGLQRHEGDRPGAGGRWHGEHGQRAHADHAAASDRLRPRQARRRHAGAPAQQPHQGAAQRRGRDGRQDHHLGHLPPRHRGHQARAAKGLRHGVRGHLLRRHGSGGAPARVGGLPRPRQAPALFRGQPEHGRLRPDAHSGQHGRVLQQQL